MTTFPSNGQVRRLAMFAAVILITAGSAIAQKGHWTKGAPFPEPSREIGRTAARRKNRDPGWIDCTASIPKAMVWQYDSATDKWQKMKDMPRAGHHLATAAYNGKLYVFGGAQLKPGGDTWVPVNNAWEYDLDKDSWRALAPMPTSAALPSPLLLATRSTSSEGPDTIQTKKRRTSV